MASWMASNRSASWRDFRAAFLQRHPSKPPTVTRHTWKALNMHNQGTYHAFLTEFNRQKALIPTGPDEVLEAFLKGLSPALRSRVEFYKNRLWKPSEFDKPVSITTERVNSVISHPATQTKPETRIRSHSQGSRLQANPSKRSFSAGPRQGPKPGIKQPGTASQAQPAAVLDSLGETKERARPLVSTALRTVSASSAGLLIIGPQIAAIFPVHSHSCHTLAGMRGFGWTSLTPHHQLDLPKDH